MLSLLDAFSWRHPLKNLRYGRIIIKSKSPYFSWATRVGVTRGGNWGCHPHTAIFSWKKWRLFKVITVCLSVSSAVSPYLFSPEKPTIFCSSLLLLLISLGCHRHPFHLSDLLCRLFFTNSPTKFFFRSGVTPRGGHPWWPAYPLTPPP